MTGRRQVAAVPLVVWGRLMTVLRAVGATPRVGETFLFRDPAGPDSSRDEVRLKLLALEPHRRVTVEILNWRQFTGVVDLLITPEPSASSVTVTGDVGIPGGRPMRVVMALFRRRFAALRAEMLEYLLLEIEAVAINGTQGPFVDPRHERCQLPRIYRYAMTSEVTGG